MVLIYVSLSVDSQASQVAELLINERLANHINIIHNNECMLYEDGKCNKTSETILLIKTKALLYKQIQQSIQKLELMPQPKIFSIPMTQLDEDYHNFLLKDVVKV